jgi:acyl-[acyl-carrier-protein]-phospholipid O-acyltransferase/long-chain-fatty-acid--[acyl-carrier-protein] ligase
MIGCLPVFHSFGFTVTMWYPILRKMRVATFPSPLDTKRLAEIIHEEKAHILIGAPTFLRPFLKRARPEQMRSLELAVAGAEKLPQDLYDGFVAQFGVEIREGYGLTETSPVLSVNHPDPVALETGETIPGHRLGSAGLMLSGMEARILDPDTLEPRNPREVGILAVRGCNVFGGYLGDDETTRAVLRDEWFVTGDLARFDDMGFLYIEGRLSRFSKMGGEMVPHITVEHRIMSAMGLDGHEHQAVVVVGVPDSAKGEALVVLTTESFSADDVREKLASAGLPNLWIPKKVIRVEKIPTLGTGKLDLRGCQRVAMENSAL